MQQYQDEEADTDETDSQIQEAMDEEMVVDIASEYQRTFTHPEHGQCAITIEEIQDVVRANIEDLDACEQELKKLARSKGQIDFNEEQAFNKFDDFQASLKEFVRPVECAKTEDVEEDMSSYGDADL